MLTNYLPLEVEDHVVLKGAFLISFMLKALITCPAFKKIMINLVYHTCFNKKNRVNHALRE